MSADPYKVYEADLRELLAALGSTHLCCSEALIYQQRLAESLAATRAYGDTETLRHDRARIVAHGAAHMTVDIFGKINSHMATMEIRH